MKRILIANRGEIAARVSRTARQMGYEVVAVYSDADARAPHVLEADVAVRIGPAPVGESYLDAARVLDAAARAGADAVHPGYGFLSENAAFARAVAEAGLTWIGPPAGAIEAMGDKAAAKRAMIAAGVPCVPGYEGADQSDEVFAAEAERIGYPVMIKAAAGGGGRGMRRAGSPGELPGALKAARSEAQGAFGDGTLLLEREVVGARHVEIQVFADTRGRVVHLGERDCSVQRRHQKVLEETPCPVMTTELRARMGQAACDAARAVDYVGAGTVEFLVDADLEFYFLEMNTRLQVEHRVTELAYGVDLVRWQLAVAEGDPLPAGEWGGAPARAVIEARVYAEDPAHGYMPQTGVIHRFEPATSPQVVVDHGVTPGAPVTPFYDPMLAKVVASGDTRAEALRVCARALREMVLLGVRTNRAFLVECLEHEAFVAGQATTGFLKEVSLETTSPGEPTDDEVALGAALLAWTHPGARGRSTSSPLARPMRLEVDGSEHPVGVRALGDGAFEVELPDGQTHALSLEDAGGGWARVEAGGVWGKVAWARAGDQVWFQRGARQRGVFDASGRPPAVGADGSGGALRAPMSGRVLEVRAAAGDAVEAGQVLIVLEAMKMEHELEVSTAGTLAEVMVEAGAQVDAGAVLAVVEPGEG
jgi:geranyl-CoA carboxylase alpha subunit